MKPAVVGVDLWRLASVIALATTFAAGCAGVPTFPTWQNISAEREARKQETLEHIDRTRSDAAEIEQASYDSGAAGSPGQPSLPASNGSSMDPALAGGMAVDPILGPEGKRLDPDTAFRMQADQAVAMGDLETAIGLYRTLVGRHPNDGALRHSLALVAEQMELHDEAALNYQEAVRLAPNEALYRMCLEAHVDRMRTERPASTATPMPAHR